MANATGLIGVIVVALMGALSVFYYFDKERRARKKEADEADDRLINVLQKTIDNLQGEVKGLQDWKGKNGEKMASLLAENNLLRQMLENRDNGSRDFQTKMLEAAKHASETNIYAKQSSEQIIRLVAVLEEHFKKIENRLPMMS